MPTEIALLDGTKFQIAGSVEEFVEKTALAPEWVQIDEDGDAPTRYVNAASIAYVSEVMAADGLPIIE